jgi:hypothetical protein
MGSIIQHGSCQARQNDACGHTTRARLDSLRRTRGSARGMRDAVLPCMLDHVKMEGQKFKDAPAGERFVRYYERYQRREAPYLKALSFFATVFSFGMAIVLPLVSDSSGLALMFAVIAAVLLPAESRFVAMFFDKIERLVTRGPKPAKLAAHAETRDGLDESGLHRVRRAAESSVPQSAREASSMSARSNERDAQAPAVAAVKVERRAPKPQPSRPTLRMPMPVVVTEPPPVSSATPVAVSDARATPCVRARVVAPRVAGTMKIWSSREPRQQPSAAPNVTIVVFPPPVEPSSDER